MTPHSWVAVEEPKGRDVPAGARKERCHRCGALRLRVFKSGGRSETTGSHPTCEEHIISEVTHT